jgi:hypothetical protein
MIFEKIGVVNNYGTACCSEGGDDGSSPHLNNEDRENAH